MKIRICAEQRDFSLTIPNTVIMNGLTARIACSAVQKHAPEAVSRLSPETMKLLFAEIDRIRKNRGTWVLAEVESARGESIEITL